MEQTTFIESTKPSLYLHVGDSDCTDEKTTYTFLNWARKISKICPFVFVGGNHDIYLSEFEDDVRDYISGYNIHYLNNETITIKGLKIFGSGYSTAYGDIFTAFTGSDEDLGNNIWPLIPAGCDIVMTHSPPAGIFPSGIGSKTLLTEIHSKKPKLHICGHIHHDHGEALEDGVHFINCASMCQLEKPLNPVLIEYDETNRKVTAIEFSHIEYPERT